MKEKSFIGDKIPPQAVDIEEAVLGAVMIDKVALSRILGLITPDTFYKEAHCLIFEAILNLSNQHKSIDLLTVMAELRKMGKLDAIGGAFYLTTLTNRVGSSANIVQHTEIIKGKKIFRDLINLGNRISNEAFSEETDLKTLVDSIEKEFTSCTTTLVQNSVKTSAELLKEVIERNDVLLKNNSVTGVPSELNVLDKVTGGFQKSDLIILAARPGMGKTALALKFARASAKSKKPVGLFSLEMSNRQLYSRVISQETNIPLEAILRRGMQDYELRQLMSEADRLCAMNIYFDDTPALSIFELKAKARRLKREKGIEMIVIDYLQLITNKQKNANRENEISEISRELKALAKELDVPIIALAQLSRASEKRGAASKPMLSDLRESGSIEQDADMVVFIYRHEYYQILQDEDGNSTIGKAELIIAKHRNGATGSVDVSWVESNTDFRNIEQHYTTTTF